MLSVAASAASHVARAQGEASPQTSAPSPKRTVPDYDGRGGLDTSPDDGPVTWTGRILLSPLYLTSEFLLRRPLGALTIAAERAEVPRKLYDFFAFGPDHKIGFVPVGFVEFGFTPSVGVYAFWDDAFVENNHVRLHTEMWPTDWFATKVTDRYETSAGAFEVHFAAVRRPDQTFYGIGPSTLQTAQSRYTTSGFDATVLEEVKVWRSTRIQAAVGLRKVDLSNGYWGSDPSLEQAAHAGFFTIPFGFDRGYTAPYARLDAAVDTRPPGSSTGSSVRLEAEGEQGGDVQHTPASGWIRYAGTASGTLDLNDRGRLLTLRVGVQFADPIGSSAPVPFTELVRLGGENWMYGYYDGRLVDRSAAVSSLEYTWPVGPWLHGLLQVAVGNVFGEHLEGFRPDLLRLSSAIGLGVGSSVPLNVIFGFGTETFAHGAQIDAFRFAIGVPRSF